jgi:hypothetical protein
MTAPPLAWTVEVESTDGQDVAAARLEAIADRLDNLATASGGALAGPALGARVPTGILWLSLTVHAPTPEDAARQAAAAFRQATESTGIGALHIASAEALDPLPTTMVVPDRCCQRG